MSLDAGELEGLSEEDLRRKYEVHIRGTVGAPGAGSKGYGDERDGEEKVEDGPGERRREGWQTIN